MYARAFLEGRLTEQNLDQLPPRAAAGRRAVVVSASLADARVLGVPHGVDGPRADHGHLPGAVQPLPHRPRHQRPVEQARVGVPGRRRMRRAGNARRHHARLARAARQSDLRRQLQPAAARRPGARQRQDHPGAGRHVPRRRLERHQGHLGRRLGSAARSTTNTGLLAAADDGSRRRPVPEVRRLRRRLHPRALLRQVSRAAGDGEELLRREAAEAAPRRPRSGEGLRRVQGGRRVQRQADRDPRQDDQGLRPGRRRRRPQHDPQPEEAQRGGAARVPHAVRHSDLRRARGRSAVLPAAGRQPGDEVPPRAAQSAGRLRAVAVDASRSR